MSNWTHVAAIARIDSFKDNVDFTKIFGKECTFYDPQEIWNEFHNSPESFLPMGSEGSLTMSVWTNPETNCLAKYTVSIFGDLRGHEDALDIICWFKDKIKGIATIEGNCLWIRNAVINAVNECNGGYSWTWLDDFLEE